MKTLSGALDAWNFGKMLTLSDRDLVDESVRDFRFALIGTPEQCAWLKEELLTPHATERERAEAEGHLRCFETPPSSEIGMHYTFMFYPQGKDEPLGARRSDGIPCAGKSLDAILPTLVELAPRHMVAMAKRFPRLRPAVSQYLIEHASQENAQIAFFASLVTVLPVLGPILQIPSLANIVLLTKNQWTLIMRLAATHGHRPGYTQQTKELLATVAVALGWRQLARGLVALLPKGAVGPAINASIAYSGTAAVGQAALRYYQSGKMLSAPAIRQAYQASQAEAEEAVAELETRAEALIAQAEKEAAMATDHDRNTNNTGKKTRVRQKQTLTLSEEKDKIEMP